MNIESYDRLSQKETFPYPVLVSYHLWDLVASLLFFSRSIVTKPNLYDCREGIYHRK